MQCPAGTKNHKKGNCPSKKREIELPEDEDVLTKKTTTTKKKKVGNAEAIEAVEGSTVSTSVSSKGELGFDFFDVFQFLLLKEASKMSKTRRNMRIWWKEILL